ncbi:MAG: hypothetical protein ABSD74_07865 [Rhizomicrobium sp.]
MLKPELSWLKAVIKSKGDLTLKAVAARLWRERGVRADVPMLSRFFRAQGLSFKKKAFTPPNRIDRMWHGVQDRAGRRGGGVSFLQRRKRWSNSGRRARHRRGRQS